MMIIPPIAKNYVVNNSKELIGRKVDIDKLKYNYFTSTARVFDFKLYEANEKDVFVSFDTLIINLEPVQLLFGEKNVEQFYIKDLFVNIEMNDSVFNFDDLIAFHSSPTDTIQTESEDQFKYHLSNLELKDSNLFFDDQSVGKVHKIENFSFVIPQIEWDQSHKSTADFEFEFENGGAFKSDINFNPVDGEYDIDVEVNSLKLNTFYEYVTQYADIKNFEGDLNTVLRIEGNTNDVLKSKVSGNAEVFDFQMIDNANQAFLKSDAIKVNFDKLDYANSSYNLGKLQLTKPYIYFEMDSVTNNFFTIFDKALQDDVEDESKDDTVSDDPLYYKIEKLIVNDGIMDYSDNLTGTRFNYHLNAIEINTDEIESTSDWITIKADMLLNNRGTLQSSLGFNPNAYDNLSLDMVIENFLLSDINVYANYYTGHSILLGDFYYYSKSDITNGEIVSENQLLVKNVSVENLKGGLYELPLKFALFLLKDRNGDVNLTLPVRGNLNDPEINIGKLIWTTFKTRITGVANDPISSIADLVDVNPKDYKALKFELTDTVPHEDHKLKLDKLLEMETVKQGLKVELIHEVDTDLQMEALAVQALGQKFMQDENLDYRKNEKAFETYVEKAMPSDTLSLKEAAFMIVGKQEIQALAASYQEKLRANVDAYLRSKKATTNIRTKVSSEETLNKEGVENNLVIKFDMLSVMADDPKPKSDTSIQ